MAQVSDWEMTTFCLLPLILVSVQAPVVPSNTGCQHTLSLQARAPATLLRCCGHGDAGTSRDRRSEKLLHRFAWPGFLAVVQQANM